MRERKENNSFLKQFGPVSSLYKDSMGQKEQPVVSAGFNLSDSIAS